MSNATRITDDMTGNVQHHAGHIIGYRTVCKGSGENEVCWQEPIYCSGHSVRGDQATGARKTFVDGPAAARVGDTGTTNCPCDGRDYTNVSGSSKVFIEGNAAVRLGDSVDIHGQGKGKIITGSNKVFMG